MDSPQYFSNLRALNKIRMVIEDWRIQILETERGGGDEEMKGLWISKKSIDKRLDELAYKRLLVLVNEYETKKGLPLTV